MKNLLKPVAIAAAALLCAGAAGAQTFPAKPVRFISQFPPGGGTDLIAQNIRSRLTESWGQTMVVEHKAGAAGNIAAEYVAKAAPDGYTVLIANNTISINAAMPQKLAYELTRDLLPVAVIAATPVVLAVHPSVAAASVPEFIVLARSQPGKLSYSSCGNGTAMHLAGELLKQMAKIDMVHIPYKGCGPAIVDGLGGQVPILFNTLSNTMPQARAGKLRVLGLASSTRSPVDAALPTIAEGGLPGFDADIWFGFMVPAGTPREIINRLNADLNRVVSLPEVRERLQAQFFSVRTSTPEEFAALIRSDIAKWGKLIRDANIKAD